MKILKLKQKNIVTVGANNQQDVYDIEVANAHHYILENGVVTHNSMSFIPQNIQAGGTGLVYNASITLELSVAKLDDKVNEDAAKKHVGSEAGTKNGVLVTAKPVKSRFLIIRSLILMQDWNSL